MGFRRDPHDLSEWHDKPLTVFLRAHPAKAHQRILAVFRQVGGDMTAAAGVLGVHRITLWRIVKRCGLQADVDAIRALVGKVHKVRTHRRGFGTNVHLASNRLAGGSRRGSS